MAIFGTSEFIPVFLGKIWNGHFLPFQICTILFGKNCWKKFRTAIFGYSEFFSDNFSVHITLIECNGLETNEICTFLGFYSEIEVKWAVSILITLIQCNGLESNKKFFGKNLSEKTFLSKKIL